MSFFFDETETVNRPFIPLSGPSRRGEDLDEPSRQGIDTGRGSGPRPTPAPTPTGPLRLRRLPLSPRPRPGLVPRAPTRTCPSTVPPWPPPCRASGTRSTTRDRPPRLPLPAGAQEETSDLWDAPPRVPTHIEKGKSGRIQDQEKQKRQKVKSTYRTGRVSLNKRRRGQLEIVVDTNRSVVPPAVPSTIDNRTQCDNPRSWVPSWVKIKGPFPSSPESDWGRQGARERP